MDEPAQPVQHGESGGPVEMAKHMACEVGNLVCAAIQKTKCILGLNTFDELMSNVHEMYEIVDKAENTVSHVNNSDSVRLRDGMRNVNDYKRRIKDFEEKLATEAGTWTHMGKLDSLKQEWSTELNNMYATGLDEVVLAVEREKPMSTVE